MIPWGWNFGFSPSAPIPCVGLALYQAQLPPCRKTGRALYQAQLPPCRKKSAADDALAPEDFRSPWGPAPATRSSVDFDLTQQAEVAQHFSCTQNHAGQRVVRNRNWQPGFFPNPLVQVLDQRAAARQHNPTVADVRAQLRRRPLQRHPNRVHNGRNRLTQRLANLAIVNRNRLGHALNQVASL